MTLVLPLVSTGNVPQLSVDLLLHSFNDRFHFIEDLDSKYLHPFVGPLDHTLADTTTTTPSSSTLYDGTSSKRFSSALELFSNKDKSIYIIQQRTPIIQGYLNNFIQDIIIPLINRLGITKLSILDSYGAFDIDNGKNNGTTATMNKGPLSNISIGTCKMDSMNDIIANFDETLSLSYDSNSSLHYTTQFYKFNSNSPIQEICTNQTIFKITYHLLNNLNLHSASSPLKEIKYFDILVHEGDNSLDAKYLIKNCLPLILSENYKITQDSEFKIPISWMGVYGMGRIPASIEEGIYI